MIYDLIYHNTYINEICDTYIYTHNLNIYKYINIYNIYIYIYEIYMIYIYDIYGIYNTCDVCDICGNDDRFEQYLNAYNMYI